MNRKLAIFIALICVIAALFVFGSRDEIAGTGTDATETTQTLTDSTGREVNVPLHPQRVIVLNASNVDLYVAAGGAENIVGKASSQAYSEAVQQATANAQDVGIIHSPNVEAIVALKPDLVIGTNVPYHQALIPTLEKAGVPVYINSLNSFEDIYSTLELFGKLTGHEDIATAKVKEMQEAQAQLVASAKEQQAPKSLVIFGNPESFSMATSKTFTGSLIEQLGGGNLANAVDSDGAYVPLSMEYLAKSNPDVIFIIMMGNPQQMQEKVRTDLESNPAWSGTNAVKNGRVHILPYNLFTVNPGTQAIEAMQVIKGYMYPEQ